MTTNANAPRPSLARLATRGALWAAFSQYTLFGLGLGKTIILFRFIGVEYFGLLAVAATWASYFSFARLDLRVAVFSGKDEPVILATQFWLENISSLIGLALAGMLVVLWPGLVPSGAWAIIFTLLLLSLFETLTSTPLYLTEKRLQQNVLGRLTILTSLVAFIVPVGLALGGAPIPALLLDAILPSLITGTGVALLVHWRPQLMWDRQQVREQLRLGWTLWSTALLGKIIFQFDDWLVGNLNRPNPVAWLSAGVTAEGFYSRAYATGKMPMDVAAGMIGRLALSLYAEGAARGREVLAAAYRQITWLLAWIVFFSSAVAFVTADEVIRLLLGEQWLPMAPLFRMMFFFVVGRPLFQNSGQLLYALRAEGEFRFAVAVQAVFTLITCPPAVYLWGAAGASVVVSVMTLIGVIVTERYVTKQLGISVWQVYVTPALVGAAVIAVAALTSPWLPANLWLAAILKGALAVLGFGAALLIFERRTAREVWGIIRQGFKRE